MAINKKILYDFIIHKEVEVEKRESAKDSDGKDFEKIVKVKELIPITVTIYKPSQKQTNDANFEYGKYLNKLIGEGFLTRAMLAKKYAKEGIIDSTFGALSKEEAKYLNKLYYQLDITRNESLRLGALKEGNPEMQEEWKKLREQDSTLRNEIVQIESQYRNLFQHTADAKAEYQEILWYALNLSYISESKEENKSYFNGDNFAEKLEDYYNKEEEENPLHKQIRDKLFLILSFWWYSGASNKEDFALLEEQLKKDSEPKVEEVK